MRWRSGYNNNEMESVRYRGVAGLLRVRLKLPWLLLVDHLYGVWTASLAASVLPHALPIDPPPTPFRLPPSTRPRGSPCAHIIIAITVARRC